MKEGLPYTQSIFRRKEILNFLLCQRKKECEENLTHIPSKTTAGPQVASCTAASHSESPGSSEPFYQSPPPSGPALFDCPRGSHPHGEQAAARARSCSIIATAFFSRGGSARPSCVKLVSSFSWPTSSRAPAGRLPPVAQAAYNASPSALSQGGGV